ncbi:NUDIX domain-containing protein [Nocardiopsis mangrovi]|uniref:NUDIX domain-containing protein n=1 Tax=Nocardiopsis mangrovi TaxID=1179818 RepID=A0ABV9DYC0_9ACTN
MIVADARGNILVAFHRVREEQAAPTAGTVPVPLALMVAVDAGRVLLVFDRARRQWELPGGRIEPGEAAADAARRELAEESGARAAATEFAGLAEFDLAGPSPDAPRRREFAAVFRGGVRASATPFAPTGEIAGTTLWTRGTPLAGASPIDTRIARIVLRGAAG